jgi:hypothetical protein
LLPEINSLKIHSLSYNHPKNLSNEQLDMICSTLDTRKITKFNVQKMIRTKEIFFLIKVFPYIVHLKVDRIRSLNIKSYLQIRDIFKEIKPDNHLRSLCLCISAADHQIIQTLQKMIDHEKLLINYTIKRVIDNIYIQWK